MKHKILQVLIAIICLSASLPTFAEENKTVVGVQTGYISRNSSVEAGLFLQYSFSRVFRASLDASMALRNNDRDAFIADLNAQFPLLHSGRWEFYPLVGVSYTSWALHQTRYTDDSRTTADDVTDRQNRLGINAGIGAGLQVTSSLKLKAEALYTGVKSNNTARVLVGIGYSF